MENKAYTTKMKRMTFTYKRYRDAWNDNPGDDRQIYCNIYDKIMEALEVMKDIDNNMIWVGFNMKYQEDVDMMNKIIEEFKEKKTA